jgi:hypothetical protein
MLAGKTFLAKRPETWSRPAFTEPPSPRKVSDPIGAHAPFEPNAPDFPRTARYALPIYSCRMPRNKMLRTSQVDSGQGPIIIAGVCYADVGHQPYGRERSIGARRKVVFSMAGPQFITPKSVIPSRSTKRFKLAEANRSLPLVRRIVSDVVKTHDQITTLQTSLDAVKPKEQPALQSQLDRAVEHLQGYVEELHEIGCDLKDYQMGLIDFIGRHRGHDVCLCWKLGEDNIAYWHEIQTGFAGRQPVSILEED